MQGLLKDPQNDYLQQTLFSSRFPPTVTAVTLYVMSRIEQYSRTVAAKPSNRLYHVLASAGSTRPANGYLERTLFSRFELPSSVMSSLAQQRVKGCGKTGQTFTLYHISIFDGSAHPLAQGFKNLACGSCASTFQKMTYGIVLCPNCADLLGFPPLLVATTASR